jgi:RNA polymerase sigma factor (sigma-70 family)
MAVVLGTALAAFSPAEVRAGEDSDRAIDGISRYCAACWRNARLPLDRWGDCTQEVFERLLERVPVAGWRQVLAGETDERREFLRAIDTVKKRHQRDRARTTLLAGVVADPREAGRDDDRDAVRQASQELLSERQQRILQLIGDGHGVADIAGELAMTPERVSDEKYKAIQKLRAYFGAEDDVAA